MEPHHPMQFSVILRTTFWVVGGLLFCSGYNQYTLIPLTHTAGKKKSISQSCRVVNMLISQAIELNQVQKKYSYYVKLSP